MRWSIRNQILVPFALVVLAGVATTALVASYQAAQRSERETERQLSRRLEVLETASFPITENVLVTMKQLSDAEFAAFDANGTLRASTLDEIGDLVDALSRVARQERMEDLGTSPRVEVAGRAYLAARAERPGSARAATILVLYPERAWRESRRAAALPALMVGLATAAVTVVVSAWLAARFGRRIRSIESRVAEIAAGEFNELPPDPRNDEIHDLVQSVNSMCRQLRSMNETIRSAERTRLLGQLAGGLAHQLRNAVTGARLAVQIHQRRCEAESDGSLEVALKQLELTEEQMKGLLSLGRAEDRPPVSSTLTGLLDDIAALVGPACRHAEVDFSHRVAGNGEHVLADSAGIKAAVLNLTLNALEAAGRSGRVELVAGHDDGTTAFDVFDTGPGPPEELENSLFDVFVSGKPEGVGLGLALAHQVARQFSGELSWDRVEGHTRFRLTVRC